MKMHFSNNETVADFSYRKRKYEIDLLLDSMGKGYASYDILDVTEDEKGECVANLYLEQTVKDQYMPSYLIKLAKQEIDKVESGHGKAEEE